MKTLSVGDVMTREVCAVSPGTEFKEIAALLTEKRISAVPVVDDQGALLGVVSEADLLPKEEYLDALPVPWPAGRRVRRRRDKAAATNARDLMTTPARTVGVGEAIPVAARELGAAGVRRLFVVEDGKLVGVLARRDLLGVFLRGDADIKAEIENEVFTKALVAEAGTYSVTVHNGSVTLLGRLETRTGAEYAGKLTASVAGVVEVHNHLDFVWDDQR